MVNVRNVFNNIKGELKRQKELRADLKTYEYKQKVRDLQDLRTKRKTLAERNKLDADLKKERDLLKAEKLKTSPVGKFKKALAEFKKYKQDSQSRSVFLK